MTDWDKRFLDLCDVIASWSKDKRKKVGAIIVSKDKRILSTGYNGLAQGLNDDDESRDIKPKKNSFFVHAEANAVFSCARYGISTKDCVMYLTWYPCCDCAKSIIQSGITKIVCYEPDWNDESWGQSFSYTKEMLTEASIEVTFYKNK